MLIQLLPNQVNQYWDKIKKAVSEGMQPISNRELMEMLDSVLAGRLTVWVSGNESGVNGVVLTCIGEDDVVKRKSFIIYFAYRFGEATGGDWLGGLDTLKKSARAHSCYRVVAYTESQEVVKLCEALGGKMKEFLIEFPIEEKYAEA